MSGGLLILALCLPAPVLLADESSAGYAPAERAVVGTVQLVLGRAYLESPGKRPLRLQSGAEVRAQDSISTESNGHVHVLFVDEALVSVRPGSILEIERYDYKPDKPAQSAVKFNLHEGVTRSISGDAAHNARQRYRLNTPIAAIGVRGTDFVVSANAESVRALVNEGVIVVAPYSEDCQVNALGPCALNAVELSENSLQMVEMEGSSPLPRLVPEPEAGNNQSLQDDVQVALQDSSDDDEEKSAETDIVLENLTSSRLQNEVALLNPSGPSNSNGPADFTPDAPISVQTLTQRQLVWGRWSGGVGVEDLIALNADAARQGREITIATNDFLLFRQEDGSKRVDRSLGVVGFSLNSAQANYTANSNGRSVPMVVNGGALNIDFIERQFNTELNMTHSLTGDVDFIANGTVSDGGYFNSRGENHSMAGAASIDGSEAAYVFEQLLQGGSIEGLTLWDSE